MTDTEKLKQYKEEFDTLLPYFQQPPLTDHYQAMHQKYLDHYNMDYTKPIIKETIQEFRRTHPVENYTSSLEDEINGYIGQLISTVNQESSFQHFIFMKMIQQHGAILKEEKELTE
ncbi:MAG: hypothetical protein KBA26_05505, partial [Candidatus Delongbacteria bacterium]|nr:hypothetical protein [Candidatus Delongbacteria bacterium]